MTDRSQNKNIINLFYYSFQKNLNKALKGQVEKPTAAYKFGMARRLLEGEALSTFELETANRRDTVLSEDEGTIGESDEVFEEVLAEITK